MAKRKQDLADKLTTERSKLPGWTDAVTGQPAPAETRRVALSREEPKPKSVSEYDRKTYLLTPEMIQEIETIASQKRVGINELVRYLLGAALDQVYKRQLEIPTQPWQRRIGE